MRRGLICLTRVSLGALLATALMCVAFVSVAPAQGSPSDPPVGFPFVPQEDFDASPPVEADAPPPTSTTPPAAEEPAAPPVPVSPPATPAPKLIGSKVGWSRRTLSVTVSCGASGTVTVLRNGRRIGRRSFTCPANWAVRVRVRIAAAAARRLRVGTPVRVKVRAGAQRDTKRMRVVRAAHTSSDAAVGRKLARASSSNCTSWFITSKVGVELADLHVMVGVLVRLPGLQGQPHCSLVGFLLLQLSNQLPGVLRHLDQLHPGRGLGLLGPRQWQGVRPVLLDAPGRRTPGVSRQPPDRPAPNPPHTASNRCIPPRNGCPRTPGNRLVPFPAAVSRLSRRFWSFFRADPPGGIRCCWSSGATLLTPWRPGLRRANARFAWKAAVPGLPLGLLATRPTASRRAGSFGHDLDERWIR